MTTTAKDNYSIYNQIEIQSVSMFRFDTNGNEPSSDYFLEMKAMVEEINIFESIRDSTVSAQLLIVDAWNLVDNFPIVGGEVIRVIYKTPSLADNLTLDFVVYKVGERITSNSNSKAQMYTLYLCTLDKYVDANIDLSMAFSGTYDEVVKGCLGALDSSKDVDYEVPDGVQSFIAPMWSPLKTVKWVTDRAIDANFSPFVFYESTDGYHFKSLKTLYKAASIKTLYIEALDSPTHINDPDKSFNTVLSWEFKASNDKLQQYSTAVFGADCYFLDVGSATVEINEYDYSQQFADNGVSVEAKQLYDDMKGFRDKSRFFFVRNDGSHLGRFQREMNINTMDAMRVLVNIPGDSTLKAGTIVSMDIPSKTGGVGYVAEKTTSGRWFVASLRHVIRRDKYTQVLELIKDSYKNDINKQITGVTDAEAKQSG